MSNLEMFKMQIQTYFRDFRNKTLLFIEMIMKSSLCELLLYFYTYTNRTTIRTFFIDAAEMHLIHGMSILKIIAKINKVISCINAKPILGIHPHLQMCYIPYTLHRSNVHWSQDDGRKVIHESLRIQGAKYLRWDATR